MSAQTMNRSDLYSKIYALSDSAIEKLAPFVDFLSYEDYAGMPHIPNAETIAAMKELEEGRGEVVTIEQIMAELNASD